MRIGTTVNTTIIYLLSGLKYFIACPAYAGAFPKNRDFAIQFFVQTIFHFSTSLRRPLVLHTIGEL